MQGVFGEAINSLHARARDAPNVSSAAQAARTRGFYFRALACSLHGVGPTHLTVHLDLARGVDARAEEEEGRKRHGSEDKAGQHTDRRFSGLVWSGWGSEVMKLCTCAKPEQIPFQHRGKMFNVLLSRPGSKLEFYVP